jgi:hypothetical protein
MTANRYWRIRETGDPSGEPLYWSNADGWTAEDAADTFTDADRATLRLPLGGTWETAGDPFPTCPTCGAPVVPAFHVCPALARCPTCGADEIAGCYCP